MKDVSPLRKPVATVQLAFTPIQLLVIRDALAGSPHAKAPETLRLVDGALGSIPANELAEFRTLLEES